MTSPIGAGSKRSHDISLALPEELFRASSEQSVALDDLSERVDTLYLRICGLDSIMPPETLTVCSDLENTINRCKRLFRPLNLPSQITTLYSSLQDLEMSVSLRAKLFTEIKENAFELIKNINALTALNEQSLYEPINIELVKKAYVEFIRLASSLKELGETAQKTVLDISFAIELEKARRKYLPIRERLIQNKLIAIDVKNMIPEFFHNLAMYDYKSALLPIVHHLIHDKYSLDLSPAKLATMPCRAPKEEELTRIQATYDRLTPDLRGSIDECGTMARYRLRETPADSGEHYKIRAKILNDFLLGNPHFCPYPSDPRTFALDLHASSPEALAPVEELNETDEKAVIITVYYFIKDELFSLSESERSNPAHLTNIIRELDVPQAFFTSFYRHIRYIAQERDELPLDAPDNWAENNACSSYLYIENGMVRAFSEILSDSQKTVFNSWYKLSTMTGPRNEASIRAIIESSGFTDTQVAKFHEELIRAERTANPRANFMNEPGWAQANAYNKYSRTRIALSSLFLKEI